MFERLAAALNFALKWFSMFDLEQTFFVTNIARKERILDHLAFFVNRARTSGKKETNSNDITPKFQRL